jgi:hypothetical protein
MAADYAVGDATPSGHAGPEEILSGDRDRQVWKPLPEIASIQGGKPLGMHLGMGSDQEIRDQIAAGGHPPAGIA